MARLGMFPFGLACHQRMVPGAARPLGRLGLLSPSSAWVMVLADGVTAGTARQHNGRPANPGQGRAGRQSQLLGAALGSPWTLETSPGGSAGKEGTMRMRSKSGLAWRFGMTFRMAWGRPHHIHESHSEMGGAVATTRATRYI